MLYVIEAKNTQKNLKLLWPVLLYYGKLYYTTLYYNESPEN